MLYICPKCHEKLVIVDNSYKCINNHTYDISSKGYVNFLLNDDKKSLHPGDTKDSLTARYDFLNKGYYKIIFNKVNDIVKKYNIINLLDIGCGVGYYTYQLKKNNPSINIYGFDIAKEALAIASRYTKKDINWFVSNSKNIPIEDNSIDAVLAMFSFITLDEIKRVLKDDGIFIQVCAGKNHLIELKQTIYDEVKIKEEDNYLKNFVKKIEKLSERLLKNEDLKEKILTNNRQQLEEDNNLLPLNLTDRNEYTTTINIDNNEDILNLFKMTPHYYRCSKEKKDIINDLNEIELTIDIIVNVYKK